LKLQSLLPLYRLGISRSLDFLCKILDSQTRFLHHHCASGNETRHSHALVPGRRTRNSPSGDDGQSSTVAFYVTNFGPACIADAIFSASDFIVRDAGI
jgi:hypothetical protein